MSEEESNRRRARGAPGPRTPPGPGSRALAAGEGAQVEKESPERGRGGRFAPPQTLLTTAPKPSAPKAVPAFTDVIVASNYFELEAKVSNLVHQYHVDFEPEVDSARVRKAMLGQHREQFGDAYLFDGQALKSQTKLSDKVTFFTAIRNSDSAQILITVKRISEISGGSTEMLQLYSNQMRRNLYHLKYIRIGHNFFDPKKAIPIPEHRIQLWPGIMTAVNHFEGKTLMVCDAIHKVVRSDTVLDFLSRLLVKDKASFEGNARKELAGTVVMTLYNNRTYKVADIDFLKSPKFEFNRRGQMVSLIQYYKEQYQLEIKDKGQPLIQCLPSERDRRGGRREPILLVPEFCLMTGLSETLRKDPNIRKRMMSTIRSDPKSKVDTLDRFIHSVHENENIQKEMNNWGISLSRKMTQIVGHSLDPEKVFMKHDNNDSAGLIEQKTSDFSRTVRKKALRVSVNFVQWVVIADIKDKAAVDYFLNTLVRVCGHMGATLEEPTFKFLDNKSVSSYSEACKSIDDSIKAVLIVVPDKDKTRYDTIKKIFCCERPVASQVVVAQTLAKKQVLMSICTKVGIQMMVKMGAEAWALQIPPRNTMIVGYDLYRDDALNKSVGGFVSSLNASQTRWFSRASYHESQDIMSTNFEVNFKLALEQYRDFSQRFPEKIVIYRDGAGDGMVPHILNNEVNQIKETLEKLADSNDIPKPNLCFIIVTKKPNARFFRILEGNRYENPMSGTVIDSKVTKSNEFFLISQSVRQGTVTPTSYNVIEDSLGWNPSHHQRLAYKMTFNYYNWMGGIRVPAPCQYAHKLVFLTATSLHREPSVALSNTLFYL